MPRAAAIATACSAAALLLLDRRIGLPLYWLLLTGLLIWQTHGHSRTMVLVYKWSLTFIVPIFVVHGILNANFFASYMVLGVIPIRPEGFLFAAHVSLGFLVISSVAGLWLNVPRDDIVESLFRWRAPLWIVLLLSQGVAVGSLVERRVVAVYLAQRARGMPVDRGAWARLRAFPSVLIPVVVSTLIEGERRVPALVSRGFGAQRPAALPSSAKGQAADPISIGSIAALLAGSLLESIL
jgi:energy-coupling factor transporter transmembrane protein EcfT